MLSKKCELCKTVFKSWPYEKERFCGRTCAFENKKRSRPEAYRTCKNCNKEFRTNPAYIKRRPETAGKFCSWKCFTLFKGAQFIPSKGKDGYIHIKQTRMHRYLMEKYLGRKLGKNEHVHHINHNKLDNRIENLKVLSASEHHKLHGRCRTGTYKSCEECDKLFYITGKRIMTARFCSMNCYTMSGVKHGQRKLQKVSKITPLAKG